MLNALRDKVSGVLHAMSWARAPRVRDGAPWYLTLACELERRNIHGGSRMIEVFDRLGLLNQVARYHLGTSQVAGHRQDVTLDVPLFRDDTRFDEADILQYEAAFIGRFASLLGPLPRPLTLLDCGADIGIFSVALAARISIDRIVAFEPNDQTFPYLESNMNRLPGDAKAKRAAVSNFTGSAELRRPPNDPSDHARYIVRSPKGEIPVTTIDDLQLAGEGTMALKVDVEGEEMSVLEGARATIEKNDTVVVGFEAHRDVARRIGQEPLDLVRFLHECKGPAERWSIEVAERPDLKLSLDRGLFEQLAVPEGEEAVFNVICRTN